jgi:3',5'-cyclic AMP phosphodiesterase CpdA
MSNKILILILILIIFSLIMIARPAPTGGVNLNLLKPADGPFCFALAGDTHTNINMVLKLSDKIKSENPSFVIINGDITHFGNPIEYLLMYELFRELALPVFTNIGNHEIMNNGSARYTQLFGPATHSFTYINSKFIFLDSSSRKKLDASQYDWLVDELKDTVANKFVITHVPLDKIDKSLLDVMTLYNVTAVLQSHTHLYADKILDNVKYITTPSAGGSSGLFYSENDTYGFINLCVNNTKVDSELISIAVTPAIPVGSFIWQTKLS